jgi:Mg2+ and Co2+ transporter CorA
MKTIILKKEHERCIFYLSLINDINKRIENIENRIIEENRKSFVDAYLFHSKDKLLQRIEYRKSVIIFVENRYKKVLNRINNY